MCVCGVFYALVGPLDWEKEEKLTFGLVFENFALIM